MRGEKVLLSGSTSAPWTTFSIGSATVTSDADGRFFVVTHAGAVKGLNAHRDAEGTWRATLQFKT
jgi:hypothetical protein